MIQTLKPRSFPTKSCLINGAVLSALILSGCASTPEKASVTLRRNDAKPVTVVDAASLPTGASSLQISPTDKLRIRVLPMNAPAQSPVFETDDIATYQFSLSSQQYHIMRGDELALHFGADSKLDTTVVVRPDGRVTLSNVAELVAAGKTPTELAADIDQAYRERVNQPASSVMVTHSNLSLAELSGEAVVQADGSISVPKLGSFKAGGLTIGELSETLSQAASKAFGNTLSAEVTRTKASPTQITENRRLIGYDSIVAVTSDSKVLLPEVGYISTEGKTVASLQQSIEELVHARYKNPLAVQVTLEASDARVVYINGEVVRPGAYPVTNALTTLKALALAGGVMDTGSLKQVVLIHRNESNDVFVYITNLNDFVMKGATRNDLIVSPQDIVLVPKTSVAKANLWVQQYISQMLPFSRNVSYSYNQGDTTIR
ncbi:MAG TPA: polysaccharide biosynthesis/export family protein [Opitutaceae bacterium]|nr:polysaccharide biosynthesis/export family protein [Opitutaceae bacterium]